MKGLKCTTSNCEFNEGFHCKAGVVNIDKRGNCITRIKRENGVPVRSSLTILTMKILLSNATAQIVAITNALNAQLTL